MGGTQNGDKAGKLLAMNSFCVFMDDFEGPGDTVDQKKWVASRGHTSPAATNSGAAVWLGRQVGWKGSSTSSPLGSVAEPAAAKLGEPSALHSTPKRQRVD